MTSTIMKCLMLSVENEKVCFHFPGDTKTIFCPQIAVLCCILKTQMPVKTQDHALACSWLTPTNEEFSSKPIKSIGAWELLGGQGT